MFSVVIPVHNKLPHLDRSIHSVLNQTFQDFELILIDDASTDGSSEKLLEYSDPRIRIFRRDTPGPGGYAARNLGIEKAKFDWISFLDADDEWRINYLSEVDKKIRQFPSVEIISCNWEIIPIKKSKVHGVQKPQKEIFTLVDFLYNPTYMWTSAITILKSLINKGGLFPAGRCRRGGDLDTWIRCLYRSKLNIYIDETLAYYYRNSINRVTDEKLNKSEFYSLRSLLEIKDSSKDTNLSQAINFYINKKIYSVLSARARSKGLIDYSLLKEVNPFFTRKLVYLKLLVKSVWHRFKFLKTFNINN